MEKKILKAKREFRVYFSELDPMTVVWYGNYLKYFEKGIEAFNDKYDLDFMKIYYEYGYIAPIVNLNCDYKKPLRFQDRAIIETTYVDSEASKLIFRYRIFRKETNELVTKGETIQVFLNKKKELMLTIPDFFKEWKRKVGLIS